MGWPSTCQEKPGPNRALTQTGCTQDLEGSGALRAIIQVAVKSPAVANKTWLLSRYCLMSLLNVCIRYLVLYMRVSTWVCIACCEKHVSLNLLYKLTTHYPLFMCTHVTVTPIHQPNSLPRARMGLEGNIVGTDTASTHPRSSSLDTFY